MSQIPKYKPNQYNLEERTEKFAKIDYIEKLPKTLANIEISKQLIRASGSVGSNYIEANESLGKKDFAMKVKTSKKEAKESRYWLRLTKPKEEYNNEKESLVQESTELMKIFGAIIEKSK
ncbi:MAG: four helix bundle protein [Candidatus Omnitrophica bacterium]|nr:four helix bundle protein [Candidatus Omnitrophota bacterium]